jgi:hypothetical protein
MGYRGIIHSLMLASGRIYATTHCDGCHDAVTVCQRMPDDSTGKYSQVFG